jgi:hypothetical protein
MASFRALRATPHSRMMPLPDSNMKPMAIMATLAARL